MNTSRTNLRDLLNNDSFCKWLEGTANHKEKEYWDSWCESNPDNKRLVSLAEKYLRFPFRHSEIPEGDISEELQLLNTTIDKHEKSVPANTRLINSFRRGIGSSSRKSHGTAHQKRPYSRNGFQRYAWAAIIALTIGVLGVLYHFRESNAPKVEVAQSQYGTIQVPYGEHKIITLFDGSKVILSAHSKFRYPLKTDVKGTINVWLDGQAFFSVIHNPGGKHRVFRIHTNDGIISDLGTQFVVNTWDNATRVVLVKGAVGIQPGESPKTNRLFTKIKPGEMARFTKTTQSIDVVRVNTDVYTSWIHNKLIFDNTPFKEAIREIEEYYGVDIEVADKGILDRKISGTIQNTDLPSVLKGISRILGLKVKYQKNTITLSVGVPAEEKR